MRVRELLLIGTIMVVGFVLALRGNECFMVDAAGLQSHVKYGKDDIDGKGHVVIPLLGWFKNEDGSKLHLLVAVNVTTSGLEVRNWVESWVAVLQKEGRVNGPAFCRMDGSMVSTRDVECEMHHQLEIIQATTSNLIEERLNVREQ